MKRLIDLFYSEIIEKKYEDYTIKRRLLPGDTRHLAFMSLLLQGLAPIEIAMLGGHTNLISQDHYQSHARYYVASEILEYMDEVSIGKTLTGKRLREIIGNKPEVCPRNISECHMTEEGIGYCTLDIANEEEICEGKEICIYCSKWWCLNTDENYEKAKKYILEEKISPLNENLKIEENFLKRLLQEAKTVRIDTLLELDKDYEEEIMSQAKKVKSIADEIVELRKTLVEVGKKQSKIPNIEG